MKADEFITEAPNPLKGPWQKLTQRFGKSPQAQALRAQNNYSKEMKKNIDEFYDLWSKQLPNIIRSRGGVITTDELANIMKDFADKNFGTRVSMTKVPTPKLDDLDDYNAMYDYISKRTQEFYSPQRLEPRVPPAPPPPAVSGAGAVQAQTTAQAQPTAAPAARPAEIKSGTQVTMPGTNLKFTYSPNWLDAAGKPATTAVAKVLTMIASGIQLDQIPLGDLQAARQSVGLISSRLPTKPMLKP